MSIAANMDRWCGAQVCGHGGHGAEVVVVVAQVAGWWWLGCTVAPE